MLEIEYLERQSAPEPEDSLLHDDWVSAVKTKNQQYVCVFVFIILFILTIMKYCLFLYLICKCF